MDAQQAKRIGSRRTVVAVLIALTVAYAIMAAMTGDGDWLFTEPKIAVNVIAGALLVIAASLFIGRYTGNSILVNKRNCYWISIKNSFYILWLGTLLGASIGFFQEGLYSPFGIADGIDSYIVKPLAMVTVFGCIPTILIASILGWSIKRSDDSKGGK